MIHNTLPHEASQQDPPITASVIRKVQAGREKTFEALATELAQAASQFEGYMGSHLMRPVGNTREYRIIYQFDCMKNFHQWRISDVRKTYYDKIDPLLIEPVRFHYATGLETWFDIPGMGSLVPPPKYKLVLVTWLTIWPLIMLILFLLDPFLSTLMIPVRAALITGIAVPTLTYLLLPMTTQWFSRWLYPQIPEQIELEEAHLHDDPLKK